MRTLPSASNAASLAFVLSEAMALVRELSTDESPTFVNGVLGAVQRDKDSLV